MQIRTVLCPVDQSDISKRAFDYATVVAQRFHARLSVMEVIDWTLPAPAGAISTLSELPAEIQEAALAALNALVAPARAAGIPTELCVESGAVVKGILDRAEAISADLLVLGTHGRAGFERLALGSVTEKVLRRAPCPVLTVPAGASHAAAPFRKILCTTDFSEASLQAVRIARDLARQMGGRCLVAHVVEWPFGPASGSDAVSDLQRMLETEARERLARTVAETDQAGGDVEAIVVTGEPKRDILSIAAEQAADLIVMGVSGRGAVNLAFLGSTSHGVIRRAECPVLTVRAMAGASPRAS